MTARTLAVQRDIAGRLVIDVMIRPVATRMTGRTGVRTARYQLRWPRRSGRWCSHRDRLYSRHGPCHVAADR